MMKILIFGIATIGDNLAYVLPLCRILHEQGHETHCFIPNENAFKLFSNVPFLSNVSLIESQSKSPRVSNETLMDCAKKFPLYDKIYVCRSGLFRRLKSLADPSLMQNVDSRIETISEVKFWPIEIFGKFDLQYEHRFNEIDINWYNQFYENFHCVGQSVLLHTQSDSPSKTYQKKDKLKNLLENHGFSVYEIDHNKDIRQNLHLIDQTKHILTVDTSIYWMARGLGKKPSVFLHQDVGQTRRFSECMLDIKNLVPWYDYLNDIPSEVIIDCFVAHAC